MIPRICCPIMSFCIEYLQVDCVKNCSELPPVSWITSLGNKRSAHNSTHVKMQQAETVVRKVSLQIIGCYMFSVQDFVAGLLFIGIFPLSS